jgi:hypothetical protein
VYPGPLDFKNRYLSNVIILNTNSADMPSGCSGVLTTPSTVITAAHCVCTKREFIPSDKEKVETQLKQAVPSGGKEKKQQATWKDNILGNARTIANGSSCLSRPKVLVISYLGSPPLFVPAEYQTRDVHPHPRFLMLNGDGDKGLFREADLAILRLETPVTETFRSIKLPRAEVRLNEDIVMVGYGLGETEYPKTAFGFRHFGESKVTRIDRLASGGTRFSALGLSLDGGTPSRIQAGDSGGGGFSKADDTVLLGIVSSSSEQHGSIFESIYPHQKWLEAEMNRDM